MSISKPIIGITCGTSCHDIHAKNPQDRLNQAYSYAIKAGGGIPVILPNTVDEHHALLAKLDGLLVSGGTDCAPSHYGEDALNDTVEVDDVRDSCEFALLRSAIQSDLPILAICRGMQILNVALGGSLWQDLPVQKPSEIIHRQQEARNVGTHRVAVSHGSRLHGSIDEVDIIVNSFHHQALKVIAPSLVVTAIAPDQTVEGVELSGARFVVAVQYHPEEMVDGYAHAQKLFETFIQNCSGS